MEFACGSELKETMFTNKGLCSNLLLFRRRKPVISSNIPVIAINHDATPKLAINRQYPDLLLLNHKSLAAGAAENR
jgi:hypothetical protein